MAAQGKTGFHREQHYPSLKQHPITCLKTKIINFKLYTSGSSPSTQQGTCQNQNQHYLISIPKIKYYINAFKECKNYTSLIYTEYNNNSENHFFRGKTNIHLLKKHRHIKQLNESAQFPKS